MDISASLSGDEAMELMFDIAMLIDALEAWSPKPENAEISVDGQAQIQSAVGEVPGPNNTPKSSPTEIQHHEGDSQSDSNNANKSPPTEIQHQDGDSQGHEAAIDAPAHIQTAARSAIDAPEPIDAHKSPPTEIQDQDGEIRGEPKTANKSPPTELERQNGDSQGYEASVHAQAQTESTPRAAVEAPDPTNTHNSLPREIQRQRGDTQSEPKTANIGSARRRRAGTPSNRSKGRRKVNSDGDKKDPERRVLRAGSRARARARETRKIPLPSPPPVRISPAELPWSTARAGPPFQFASPPIRMTEAEPPLSTTHAGPPFQFAHPQPAHGLPTVLTGGIETGRPILFLNTTVDSFPSTRRDEQARTSPTDRTPHGPPRHRRLTNDTISSSNSSGLDLARMDICSLPPYEVYDQTIDMEDVHLPPLHMEGLGPSLMAYMRRRDPTIVGLHVPVAGDQDLGFDLPSRERWMPRQSAIFNTFGDGGPFRHDIISLSEDLGTLLGGKTYILTSHGAMFLKLDDGLTYFAVNNVVRSSLEGLVELRGRQVFSLPHAVVLLHNAALSPMGGFFAKMSYAANQLIVREYERLLREARGELYGWHHPALIVMRRLLMPKGDRVIVRTALTGHLYQSGQGLCWMLPGRITQVKAYLYPYYPRSVEFTTRVVWRCRGALRETEIAFRQLEDLNDRGIFFTLRLGDGSHIDVPTELLPSDTTGYHA